MPFRFISYLFVTLAMVYAPQVLPNGEATLEIEKIEVSGIENFSQINADAGYGGSRVGFGGATQPGALALLKEKGFVTVINLRLADEDSVDLQGSVKAASTAGLNYINLPFDKSKPDTVPVDSFLAAVGNVENHPVYIHCSSATRAAALWMIGRVLIDDWDVAAASAEARQIALKPDKSIAFATWYLQSRNNVKTE